MLFSCFFVGKLNGATTICYREKRAAEEQEEKKRISRIFYIEEWKNITTTTIMERKISRDFVEFSFSFFFFLLLFS